VCKVWRSHCPRRPLPTPPVAQPPNCRVAIAGNPASLRGMKTTSVVKIDPEILSGTPCFAGTRVPARTLIDYLEGGDSLESFLEDFPTVSREQAVALLEEASELLALAPA
jgi:uncharacterized protein (DUF433 family)